MQNPPHDNAAELLSVRAGRPRATYPGAANRHLRSTLRSAASLAILAMVILSDARAAQFAVTNGTTQTEPGSGYSAVAATPAANGSALFANNANSVINGANLALTSNIVNALGALAQNGGAINLTGGTIATSATGAHGASATSDGDVTISGATAISATGQNAIGLLASGSGSTILATGATINATNFGSYGASAENGASITLTSGSATSVNSALRVITSGALTASNVSATATGSNAIGVNADSGTINLTGGSVTALVGTSDHGLNASGTGGRIVAQGVTVSSETAARRQAFLRGRRLDFLLRASSISGKASSTTCR